MATVASALARLSTGRARARAAGWARRRHVQLLLLAVLLAAATRWIAPLPGVAALVGALAPALAAAALLLAAGLLLRLAAVPWLRVAPARLAAELDDRQGWHDTLGTALDVERRGARGPLPDVLALRAGTLLATLEAPAAARPAGRRMPWGRIGLAALFVALLLLPGVSGTGLLEGAGRGGEIGLGHVERPAEAPYDADQWLREHGRLLLARRDPTGTRDPTGLVARFHTLARLPEDYAGDLALVLDDRVVAPLGPWAERAGVAARLERELDPLGVPQLVPHLTPGAHRVRVRLAPTRGPWSLVLRSNEVEIVIPPGGGGGGEQQRPAPRPEPEAPPMPEPPPTPAPTPGPPPEPTPPEPPEREEAVTPVLNEGLKVRKEGAVVAVKDPDAGLEPPRSQPLEEALRDFDKVLERAVGGERLTRRDIALLEAYFRALRALTEPGAR